MSNSLKKYHVVTKTCWHCFWGLAEYIGIPLFLAWLSTYLSPIPKEECLWEWVERTAFCFTIYEVVIVGVRKMQIDIRKDALLALKTAYERAELYCETGSQFIYDDLGDKVNRVLDNGILNQLDIIQCYRNLLKYMDRKNTDAIRYEIIKIQHSLETDGLLWNYTLLLRLFKR
jgi:hypothetical protein